jgi:hypothetical protein
MYDCGVLFFAAFSFLAMQRTGADLAPERRALRCRLNRSLCLVRALRPCKKDNPDARHIARVGDVTIDKWRTGGALDSIGLRQSRPGGVLRTVQHFNCIFGTVLKCIP